MEPKLRFHNLLQINLVLIAHPNLAAGIASLAGSVASGMLPAWSFSCHRTAGASALSALSEFVRIRKLQKQINEFRYTTFGGNDGL